MVLDLLLIGLAMQPWALVAAGASTVLEAKLATAGSYLALMVFCR